jgi:uncharacterized protein YjbI with pentapeptide repeats
MSAGSGRDRCEYTHHRDDVPTGPRIESMSDADTELTFDEEGYWHCQQDAHAGLDHCVFHAPDEELPDDVDYARALVDRIRDVEGGPRDRHRRRQFVGLSAPELDLSDLRLTGPDNFPLDLRCADVGTLRCRNGRFEMPVDLRGADVDEMRAEQSRWESLHVQHATVGTAAFDRATVEEGYFEHVTADRLRFYFAEVGYSNLHHAELDYLNFMYADLGEMGFFHLDCELATFFGAEFSGAYLNDAAFGYVNFQNVSGRSFHFSGVQSRGARFDGSRFRKASLSGASFEHATFRGCAFETTVLDRADLGVSSLAGLECSDLSMAGTTFEGSLSLEGAVVEDTAELSPRPVDGERGYVSLRDAVLGGGTVDQPDDGAVVYDLEGATLGSVVFSGGDAAPLLELLRFVETSFEGFDFRHQTDADLEAREYDVHTMLPGSGTTVAVGRRMQDAIGDVFDAIWEDDGTALDATDVQNSVDFESVAHSALPEDPPARARKLAERSVQGGTEDGEADALDPAVATGPDPGLLESTYLRAKNGAADVGNTTVAGRFFERERRYRRQAHWRRVLGGGENLSWLDRIRFGSRGVRGKLMSVTCGYGERPWRVVGSSLGIILLFAGAYALVGLPLSGQSDPSWLDYLVFSGQNFVTFIVGTSPETSSFLLRATSTVEGFLGAFFVGLFVFALTRTVHR